MNAWLLIPAILWSAVLGFLVYNYGHSAGLRDSPEHYAYLEAQAQRMEKWRQERAAEPDPMEEACERIFELAEERAYEKLSTDPPDYGPEPPDRW